jgi:cation diffusion facilitator CzcD-associated flavoprotein CzcO
VGQLARPAVPSIPGLEDFEGPVFHSAEWDHGVPLAGRRVAVIGTGASAIQFVPEIAPVVSELTIYQRSAPWILPKLDRAYPEWEQRLFRRFPARVARLVLFVVFEGGTYAFTGKSWVMRPLRLVADATRRRALPEPGLRRAATPDYEMGCKRLLITSNWYPTLRRPNVSLLNGRVGSVTPGGVVGPDGVERPTDVIIFGTGFQSHGFVAPMELRGLEGRSLASAWGSRPEAFLGTTVSGFPNMFMLYGPNTNHGSGSVPYLLESQSNYVLDAVRRLRVDGVRYLDLRPDAQSAWRREMEERSRGTVWVSGGCHSWYVNEAGENTNNWPGPWLEYRRRTRRLDPGDYVAVG